MSGIEFLDSAARQAALARGDADRPWPLPARPWSRAETQPRALLLHWPVAERDLRRLVPRELALESCEGACWLGGVALEVHDRRLRGLPPLPGLSSLRELEWRAYVSHEGRPGIWPLAIESSSRLQAEALKRSHRLPAFHARVSLEQAGRRLRLSVERDGLRLNARAQVAGSAAQPQAGTLERFLCERYCVYTSDGGRLYRAELQPSPALLRPARAVVEECDLAPLASAGTPRAWVAARRDLLVWSPEEL